MTAICLVCNQAWDIDFDPPACTCSDPADDDWILEVEE